MFLLPVLPCSWLSCRAVTPAPLQQGDMELCYDRVPSLWVHETPYVCSTQVEADVVGHRKCKMSAPAFAGLLPGSAFPTGVSSTRGSPAPLHVTAPEVKAGLRLGGVAQTPAEEVLVGRGVFPLQHRAMRTLLGSHPARAEPILPELREAATAWLGSMDGAGTRKSWPEKYSPLVTQGQASP